MLAEGRGVRAWPRRWNERTWSSNGKDKDKGGTHSAKYVLFRVSRAVHVSVEVIPNDEQMGGGPEVGTMAETSERRSCRQSFEFAKPRTIREYLWEYPGVGCAVVRGGRVDHAQARFVRRRCQRCSLSSLSVRVCVEPVSLNDKVCVWIVRMGMGLLRMCFRLGQRKIGPCVRSCRHVRVRMLGRGRCPHGHVPVHMPVEGRCHCMHGAPRGRSLSSRLYLGDSSG
ncbi:hypothetical protein L226DRAFT_157114 [Lentinus tigrinus ALCF2SS1-7]|uniref:uncharacterized protein n=1 Tax=Lentinus tigrinus ALCF2SS1-7 TaxID=1328758 RepID=UPI001165FE7D|nr:hypothetical protein L226DRAFT_157114 [Lentinus tigrinus ALCF2SS1-7]